MLRKCQGNDDAVDERPSQRKAQITPKPVAEQTVPKHQLSPIPCKRQRMQALPIQLAYNAPIFISVRVG